MHMIERFHVAAPDMSAALWTHTDGDPLLPNETCRRTGIMLVTILKEASHEIM